jgi:hypothetical protein
LIVLTMLEKRQKPFRPLDIGSHINVPVERRAAGTAEQRSHSAAGGTSARTPGWPWSWNFNFGVYAGPGRVDGINHGT